MSGVGASQYAFFSTGGGSHLGGGLDDDPDNPVDALDLSGGLEDGIEAPPEEERLTEGDAGLGGLSLEEGEVHIPATVDEEGMEDYSLAAIFAPRGSAQGIKPTARERQAAKEAEEAKAARDEQAARAARAHTRPMQQVPQQIRQIPPPQQQQQQQQQQPRMMTLQELESQHQSQSQRGGGGPPPPHVGSPQSLPAFFNTGGPGPGGMPMPPMQALQQGRGGGPNPNQMMGHMPAPMQQMQMQGPPGPHGSNGNGQPHPHQPFVLLQREKGPGQRGAPRSFHQQNNYNQQLHARNKRPSYHWYTSSIMSKDEIDTLLRIQWAATHAGRPYFEDYYYLAFLKKAGELKGKFSPVEVFGGPTQETGKRGEKYLAVEGLGKIPLSNIRRPKPMMDFGDVGASGEGAEGNKSLDQEPLLAARVLIEDCLGLLLDVDDVDRMLDEREVDEENAEELNKRRVALLDSILSSFNLPQSPSGDDEDDSVFIYIAHLRKGQKLISGLINKSGSGAEANQILWSVFRNMNLLFDGNYAASSPMAGLSMAVAESISKLDIVGVCQSLAAFLAGDCKTQGLPIKPSAELFDCAGHVLCALLSRASGLGLGVTPSPSSYSMDPPPPNLVAAWAGAVNAFFQILEAHMESLISAGGDNTEQVRKQVPVVLIRAMLPHAEDSQRDKLRQFLIKIK
eukprot:CAMPEP_0197474216 /NCGR_PEP_ID=MMETSP1309-20131121/5678_1 /TAXON_ID=464262 /ORGANISM="Genus nov. species nov., Strain RCC998" /LENGTH=679 /DNA_ID=CAMNT_0043013765 /DNA_START=222 /DNA_END=2261 /DNA_ORIENTATION=-